MPAGARALRARAAAACWSPARRRRRRCRSAASSAPATTQGYWRIHDRTRLPSLRDTDLLFVDGEYVELAPLDPPLLTLIPTAMFGPPEKVWSDKVETTVPGLVFATHGTGPRRLHPVGRRRALLPPQLAGARGAAGRRDRSAAAGRAAAAHRRASAGRDDADGAAVARADAACTWSTEPGTRTRPTSRRSRCATSASNCRARVRRVRAVALGRDLPVTGAGGASVVTLPRLDAYEVLEIER